MVGRRLCSEQEATGRGFGSSNCARRRQVLHETIARFDHASPSDRYHQLAQRNLNRWRDESGASDSGLRVNVYPDDWGEVTRSLSMTHGICFAVLNMANAYVPGGAYVEGAIAQEENMLRRTDCHFRVGEGAAIYREEIAARAADFSVIAFAIFSAGYGPDNFTSFARVWGHA